MSCFHSLENETRDLDEDQSLEWLRDPSDPKICTSLINYLDRKNAEEQLCAITKNCLFQVPDQPKGK